MDFPSSPHQENSDASLLPNEPPQLATELGADRRRIRVDETLADAVDSVPVPQRFLGEPRLLAEVPKGTALNMTNNAIGSFSAFQRFA